MTINYRIRGTQKDKKNIILDLSVSRELRFKISTGLSIDPKQWNENKGMPKSIPAMANLTKRLKDLSVYLENEITNFKGIISGEWVKMKIDAFNGKASENSENLLLLFDKKIQSFSPSKINSIKSYQTAKNQLEKYQNHIKKEISITDFTPIFAEKYIQYMKDKGLSVNSIRKYIASIITIINDVNKKGGEVPERYQFIKTAHETKTIEEIIFLNFEELKRIKALDLSNNIKLENAQKWILLGCDVGQRYSDLMRINPKDIFEKNGHQFLRLQQQKTGAVVTIPIFEDAKAILSGEMPYPMAKNTMIYAIQEVCKLAQINELCTKRMVRKGKNLVSHKEQRPKYECVGTHTLRRSFASNYYTIIDTPLLKNITGHSTEKMFLNYIGVGSNDTSELALQQYLEFKRK